MTRARPIERPDDRVFVGPSPDDRTRERFPVLTIDAAGRIHSVSTDFEETSGQDRNAVLGHTITELAEGIGGQFFQILQDAVRRFGESVASGVPPAPSEVPAGFAIVPTFDAQGGVTAILAIRRDAAARHPPPDSLPPGSLLERIGPIVGAFAHHFNNALTPVRGHAQMIAARLPEGDTARANAEMIVRAADRASSIVRKLLSFSRRLVLEPEPFELNAFLESMDPNIRSVANSGIEVDVRLSSGPTRVNADIREAQTLLMDLVTNACEAMPAGGRLVIGTDHLAVARSFRRGGVSIAPGRYVVLSLRDSGVGMNQRTREMAFEPFFTTKSGAIGLGLSSAYGFVKQSGGYLWVDGHPGRGAQVTVYFPSSTPDEIGA